MKTIREWLNELPEKERARAFNNVNPEMLEATYPSMHAALHRAFVWADSKEKHEYWNKIANQYN